MCWFNNDAKKDHGDLMCTGYLGYVNNTGYESVRGRRTRLAAKHVLVMISGVIVINVQT
jgi:hypothetical protein